jgi:hypothetical protein
MRPGSLTLDVASALLTNLQGWARSADFAVPKCTGDTYKHVEYDLRVLMDVFRRSGRTIYFLFGEVKRFFQVVDDPDRVLFKTLLQVGATGTTKGSALHSRARARFVSSQRHHCGGQLLPNHPASNRLTGGASVRYRAPAPAL